VKPGRLAYFCKALTPQAVNGDFDDFVLEAQAAVALSLSILMAGDSGPR